GVRSLSDGPKDFADALKSPLWRRLLIADKQRSSNVIVLIEGKEASKLIQRVEEIIKQFNRSDFVIRIAGPPYVVAMIQRNLVHDFAWFSATAVILFGGAMVPVFRSVRILIGMLATCITAIMFPLIVQALSAM